MHEATAPFPLDGDTAETWYRIDGDLRPDDPDAPAPLVVLHGGPDVPELGRLGHPAIREALLEHPPTLVVCGHCHWKEPLATLANGTQVVNVDSRLIVLRGAGA